MCYPNLVTLVFSVVEQWFKYTLIKMLIILLLTHDRKPPSVTHLYDFITAAKKREALWLCPVVVKLTKSDM